VDQEKIERALDACYDAVLAPETWPQALQMLARSLDAAAIMFYPFNSSGDTTDPRDPNRRLDLTPMSPEYVSLIEEYLRNQWYLNHYRAERGVPLLNSGRAVVIEHDLATDEERKTLRPYNELYLPWGFPGYAMAGFRVDGNSWAVPMLRGKVQGHFTRKEVPGLAALIPHFARMIRLSERLAIAQAQVRLDMLDRLACPALLIDWKGAVIRTNAGAAALMGRDLRIFRGALTAADACSNRELQNLIQWLRVPGQPRGGAPPSRVFIHRVGQAPLVIDLLPAAGLAADAFHTARAVLVVTDLDDRPTPPEDALRSAFGLTAAEARLALHLARGETLDDACDALGIAKETARAQLKAVFGKTRTSRQSALVALIARLPTRSKNFSAV
jgi:DNA-binding CsgD family transcriptional regulator